MAKKEADGSKRKPFESKFDEKVLRELILAGKSAEEIQTIQGIVSKQSLRQHVLKLIHRDRTFYEIPGLYVRNLTRPFVNFKGEIKISKKMLDFQGSTYAEHDQFEIQADNEKIVLTRIKESEDSLNKDTGDFQNS